MSQKKVVLIGWHPDVVDYSKWPGLTPEKLRAALEGDRDNLNSMGYAAELLFIESADTAYDTVTDKLSDQDYAAVLIGAGVRTVDEHFLVFEQLVNAVHASAPGARICFNTNPADTAAAVQRWV
ncbi:MAG: hypothetical protein QNJ69_13800 [Gammaproteobacteria bacterium]|nr:hypothetical protein [Gammaproteobacteria bacterium]